MTVLARLAYTYPDSPTSPIRSYKVTLRRDFKGEGPLRNTPGYVRINGKTVSGHVVEEGNWEGFTNEHNFGFAYTFFADGKNYDLLYPQPVSQAV